MSEATNRKIKVFVSSTYEDLKDYRNECIRVLDRLRDELDIDCVGMETFGADDSPPKEYCLRRVQDSDMYVGIFGMRYGSIDEETGASITELEYRKAEEKRLPCLIYLMEEKHTLIRPEHVDTGPKAEKLQNLKRELSNTSRGHMVGFFWSPENLAAQLAVDLFRGLKMLRGDTLSGLRKRIDRAILRGPASSTIWRTCPGVAGLTSRSVTKLAGIQQPRYWPLRPAMRRAIWPRCTGGSTG
jgi:hypothetical protein